MDELKKKYPSLLSRVKHKNENEAPDVVTSDSDLVTPQLPKVFPDSAHAYKYIQQSSSGLIKILQETSTLDNATISPWIADAQKLASFKVEPRKLVVIGRTGAGKSTAISALCGRPILATGADNRGRVFLQGAMRDFGLTWKYSACTSAPTEVIYEDIGNVHCRATVKFLSTALTHRLRRSPADETSSSGSRQDSGPAKAAWEILCQVYPQ
ncbi:hypothetical protein BJ138DRAFT_1201344 [Hygrophoropsis aurantiaca]|uniref:Uncharacterized protein n=1 Tax=Hygrophoropsis aurantiaca TaxID=72124 RepID=A0ACB7ZNY0_9AGAM|nr:hypothetical protein BJ138DRAFT_1201344 [Hygrophoropsis aurantiaca]